MRKVKLDLGELTVIQKVGDYTSPTFSVKSPPSYVMTDSNEVYQYLTNHLAEGSFIASFTTETIQFSPASLN